MFRIKSAQSSHVSPRAAIVCVLLIGGLCASSPASGNTIEFFNVFGFGGQQGTWVPPEAGESNVIPRPYFTFSMFTEDSGDYRVSIENDDSQPGDGTVAEALPGALFLYQSSFDPTAPLDNLIDSVLFGSSDPAVGEFVATLASDVRYILVTTAVDDYDGVQSFRGSVSSLLEPDLIQGSPCSRVGDELSVGDSAGDGWAFQQNKFCAVASWRSADGQGFAEPVGYRTDDSMLFWFFQPENWELQVKILDGCSINGHYWVFASASTDVEVNLEVFGRGPNIALESRSYSNALGNAFETITDTQGFPCDQVVDADL